MAKRAKDKAEDKRGKAQRGRKGLRVPPPESSVWPEEYRGENWKSIYATLFAGKCQLCAYACPLPRWCRMRDRLNGEPRLLLCTNHPDSPGELHEVLPIETCRNFKPKWWRKACCQPAHRDDGRG